MDILVSKNGNYYDFWAAEERDGKVYLRELYKDIVKKYAIGKRTIIKPTDKMVDKRFEKVLTKKGNRYIINNTNIEIIERYNPEKEYFNISLC